MKLQRIFIYSLVSLSATVTGFLKAHPALAQVGDSSGLSSWVTNPLSGAGWHDLPSAVRGILNIVFALAGIVAVVFLIIGGFRYVTSGGNAEASEGAKTTILNAIIGLVVIFLAFLLVNFVLSKFQFTSEG